MENQIIYADDDGLVKNEEGIGAWSEDKYILHRLYCQLFSTGMKDKWAGRTYIDLYAGSGFSQQPGRTEIFQGSPLLAMSVDAPFNTYVFCENDTHKLEALKTRAQKLYSTLNAFYISGDCNSNVQEIISRIPHNNLSLCFVDPYDLNLKFSTLKAIADARKVDFLCLLATGTDANRNFQQNYMKPTSNKVADFLGNANWRSEWDSKPDPKQSVASFIVGAFGRSMERIGYLPTTFENMKDVKTNGNVTLYKLALFSKNPRGFDFWQKVLKSSNPQRGFVFPD